MNAQERRLIADLFDRMRTMPAVDKDRDAEDLIAGEMRRFPDACYLLVQTVLVQNEALERAEERIRDLEGGEVRDTGRSFLGGAASARTGAGTVPAFGRTQPAANAGMPSRGARAEPRTNDAWTGGASSFLGSALTTAAGVAGGLLLADGIRGLFDDGNTAAGKSTEASQHNDAGKQSAEHDDNRNDDRGVQEADHQDDGGDGWDFGEMDV